MENLSRRAWVDLLVAHPCPDPGDPSDEFAAALITAVGGEADVWETGGQHDALTAYQEALGKRPDPRWAVAFLRDHPDIHLEVSLCAELGIAYEEFLTWDARSQDLAIAAALLKAEACPHGHPKDLQVDENASKAERVRCAACANQEEMDRLVAKQREHVGETKAGMGWTTRVVAR